MKRLISGIKPTGQLHIGNYLGAIKQWIELQNDYDCFFFIADYHALTVRPSKEDLINLTQHVTAMLIALGIDPDSAIIFRQSDISEHTELSWILSNFASVGELKRMTQFKEKSSQDKENAGLFTYPILMSADVLIYDADVVPVGEDQIQHLELTREIARRFNNHYSKVFVEPKPLLNKAARIMALNNPQKKMSKSVSGSSVGLLDKEADIIQTITRAVTDSDPNASSKSPALTNLFNLLEGFSDRETYLKFDKLYSEGKLQYKELKEQLIEDILVFLKPVQAAYRQLEKEPETIKSVLERGKTLAQEIAQVKLIEIKKAIGLERLKNS